MLCKFCNAEMDDDRRYCPVCGKRQDSAQKPQQKSLDKKKKKTKVADVLKIVLAVVLVVTIICLLVYLFVKDNNGNNGKNDKNEASVNTTTTAAPQETEPAVIPVPESEFSGYTGVKVAETNGKVLTNDLLQMFYTAVVNELYSEYGSTLAGTLDLSKPFDQQTCPFEEVETWDDYFRVLALERWQFSVAMCKVAEDNGFQLSDEWKKSIDEVISSIDEMAQKNNYENGEAMIKSLYGHCCTVETYREYLTLQTTVNNFYYSLYEVTDEDIQSSYEANKEELTEEGITQNSALVSSVRHILIVPEGGTKDEQGQTVYTDAEWEACKAEAEKVYEEWKNGAATEESFAELVSKYTEDKGSATTGGLYENVANDGTYVKEFQDWAIDVERKTGDTAIVRTPYGYHIMYFVSGEPEWIAYSRMLAQQENILEAETRAETIMEENPAEVYADQIVMQNVCAE